MPTIHPKDENPYFIDAESAAEMTRLTQQGQLLTQGMGGLLPPQMNVEQIYDVLDIGCGPGGWVLDVAYTYPEMEVTGIDTSKLVIEYAQAMAKVRRLDNAHFEVMDALKPLDFPDNSFDFVNGRFLFGFMSKETWPQLVKECWRILRPGGILRLTECEAPLSNSASSEKLYSMVSEALYKSGRSFSPDGGHVGIVPMLGAFLREAGFQDIHQAGHALDCSAGQEAYDSFYQDFRIGMKLLVPFFVKLGLTTEEEYEVAYQQALAQMLADDFSCIWLYLSVWGQKPVE
jgi:ubiquinone/menaquinone biosynthesis C-methylase UbiE